MDWKAKTLELGESILNLNNKKGKLTIEDIEAEVINYICLQLFLDNKNTKKDYIEYSENYTKAARIFFPEYDSSHSAAAQSCVIQNMAWEGNFDFVKKYYLEKHGIQIAKKTNKVNTDKISKFHYLSAGVYAGFDAEANYGWLLKTFSGGICFFINGFTNGLINHSQIDEHVQANIQELDPEKDAEEYRQLHELIQKIGDNHPAILPLLKEVELIVSACSLAKYNDLTKIKFPQTGEIDFEIAKTLLSPILRTIENNKFGRTYRIIEYRMIYKGIQTCAAIIPNKGTKVAPVVLGGTETFTATPDMPQEELTLFLKKYST